MPRKRRQLNTFSLSFLDIMACGFGAVTLLFLILKHDPSTVSATESDTGTQWEAAQLQADMTDGERQLSLLRNSLDELEEKLVETQGLSDRVLDDIKDSRRELSAQSDPEQQLALLRKQVATLEQQTADLEDAGASQDLRPFIGDGDRQYLTGLKLGGNRVLILVDASASMLAETIINVVRRRNMSAAVKRQSPKWQRALRTAEWLVAQLPARSQYQLYTFNTKATPVLANSHQQWQDAADNITLDAAIMQLKKTLPTGGTSLMNAFAVANAFSQRPDNIFLITDGLPTQGESKPSQSTVSGKARAKLFESAVSTLPKGVPVNIILFPMEGDPEAAALFWQLGLLSRGAFLSPSRDWP
ncbi:MAG: VWA domain-containing protein [Gammaproteobacteria bacterium]|nr:VWA domain-containing protein [Gammaproteobacteria bacterium]MBQ0840740.1 VWA domain-containing protein [Gammaproteobacteria bacterium]